MGSLNSDGSRISQTRRAVKRIGGALVFSADGVEGEVEIDKSASEASSLIGTEADRETINYATYGNSVSIKTVGEGGELIERVSKEVADGEDIEQNPPWVGIGGGGSQDLEGVLEQGNTGSGIVLSELLLTPRIMPTPNDSNEIFISYDDSDVTYVYVGEDTVEIRSNGTCTLSSDNIRLTDRSFNPVLTTTPTKVMAYVPLNSRRDVEVVTIPSGGEITLSTSYDPGVIVASGQVIIVKGSGPRTVKLQGINPPLGLIYDIKDGDGTSSSGNITIVSDGSNHTIDGQSEFVIDVNYASYTFLFNGTEWNLI